MRASLEFGFKDPGYSLILNLLPAHFKELFYKANNQLMFIVQVSSFFISFFNFLTGSVKPKIDSKVSLDGQIENLAYLQYLKYLFSIYPAKQTWKKISHICTVVSTDLRQFSTLMGHSSTILAHHCPITVPHTIYKKLLKQNKLSLESLSKNKFDLIKNYIFKKCAWKKAPISHDNQIEFGRKIDRTTHDYDFKISRNNQISKAEEA